MKTLLLLRREYFHILSPNKKSCKINGSVVGDNKVKVVICTTIYSNRAVVIGSDHLVMQGVISLEYDHCDLYMSSVG